MQRIIIHVGELYASREPAIVETVLGSCVAACVFDPVRRLGGMNHFLLPEGSEDDPLPTRYGREAMRALIRRILQLGGVRNHLRAKVFGAANVLTLEEMRMNVARANERFIREFLAEQEIPLLAERMGGRQPLKVRMFTATGKVLARALPEAATRGVAAVENEHFSAAIARRWSWFEEGAGLLAARRGS
jgi:chemotaxis receptor (MCP) glutamine deamidase CheD